MINVPENRIRVLVVDDSAFMRSAIKGMLKSAPEIDVIATARDGLEAIEKIEKLRPDIVTMDIEMPRLDGLSALKIIMERNPVPVLILSSLTTEGAEMTLKALDLGAVDFICKDLQSHALNILNIENTLVAKIREIAQHHPRAHAPGTFAGEVLSPVIAGARSQNIAVVALGVSTGGPRALQDVIPYLPKDFPVPVLVVQHMPALFTKPFSERMDGLSQLDVKEAETGDLVEPGKVFIGRGGIHMKVKRVKQSEFRIELDPEPRGHLYHPSVDIMMFSAVEAYAGRVLGVIMTGMGNDGTEGLKAIKQNGGKTLAQDAESCVVYGMPKSAVEAGVIDKVAPLSRLASEIANMV